MLEAAKGRETAYNGIGPRNYAVLSEMFSDASSLFMVSSQAKKTNKVGSIVLKMKHGPAWE